MPKRKPTILLLADYGNGDAAFTEVVLQLHTMVPDACIIPQSISKFSTINTGFWIFQLSLTPNLENTYIFSNTAPRRDRPGPRRKNVGEKLMYAKLENGFELLAVNSGYTFSFIKPHIRKFHEVNTENMGSQFRSRDKYPRIVAKMVSGDYSFLGRSVGAGIIPEYPKNVLAHVDKYGNMKTTARLSEMSRFRIGEKVMISIGDVSRTATYAEGIFAVREKELAFAPGSSGHDDRFMEIAVRYGSAHELFRGPDVEAEFKVGKA